MDKCVRYLRVSTERQDENNQIRAIDELIKEKRWKCIKTYKDRGLSAYKENVTRPDFEQMLVDAKQRKFQHIVVFDLDRFSRRPEGEVLALIKNLRLVYGIQIHACFGDEWKIAVETINDIPNMGIIGEALSEFLEKIFLGMQARASRRESEKISRRILASKKFQKARKEKRIGRPRIPDDVIILVESLLEYDVPYAGIVQQVYYKNAEGAIMTPSPAYVSIIKKCGLRRGQG